MALWVVSLLVAGVLGEEGIPVRLLPQLQDNEVGVEQEAVRGASARAGHGDEGLRGAIAKLDNQFLYLLAKASGLVDPVVAALAADCERSRLKTQTYGAALLAGGAKDTAADFIGNNRVVTDPLTMPDVAYGYIYNMGYALGFGGPYLLPTYLPDCTAFTCSRTDLLAVVQAYELAEGLAGKRFGEARMRNFGADALAAVGCAAAGASQEAAGLRAAIEDLVEAGVQRLRLSRHLQFVH